MQVSLDWTNTTNTLLSHSSVHICKSTRSQFIPVRTSVIPDVFVKQHHANSCFSPLQRNMWRVTLADPQRPSCRRTLASISCSVKRATPAAPSPALRPASRLWRARGRSSAPKPTKYHRTWARPPLSASPFPHQKGRHWGCPPSPFDLLKGLSESNCRRVWLLFSCVMAETSREWDSKGVQAL